MPKRRARRTTDEATEEAIRRAGTIGGLERLAGIGPDDAERYRFWKDYSHLQGGEALDAGVAELKRRIRAQAGARAS